jgi:hypothetical protein
MVTVEIALPARGGRPLGRGLAADYSDCPDRADFRYSGSTLLDYAVGATIESNAPAVHPLNPAHPIQSQYLKS